MLVQLVDGTHEPIETADCTVADYRLINHPTKATVEAVVDTFEPTEVVIQHQVGEEAKQYREELSPIVWAVDGTEVYNLHDGDWLAPPWMTRAGRRYAHNWDDSSGPNGNGFLSPINGYGESERSIPVSSLTRTAEADLEAEGLDMNRLAARLRIRDRSDERKGSDSMADSVASQSQATPRTSKATPVDSPSADGKSNGDTTKLTTEPGNGPGSATDITTTPTPTDSRATANGQSGSEKEAGEQKSERGRDLDSITARLDRIESKIDQGTETTVPARVVDIGDSITLLRVRGDLGIEPGESVSVTVQSAIESDERDEDPSA